MTDDDRAEKLARAIFKLRWRDFPYWGIANDMAQDEARGEAQRALAAIDADPETYGYTRLNPAEKLLRDIFEDAP